MHAACAAELPGSRGGERFHISIFGLCFVQKCSLAKLNDGERYVGFTTYSTMLALTGGAAAMAQLQLREPKYLSAST